MKKSNIISLTPTMMEEIIARYKQWKPAEDATYFTIDVSKNFVCPAKLGKECCTTKAPNCDMCMKCRSVYNYNHSTIKKERMLRKQNKISAK